MLPVPLPGPYGAIGGRRSLDPLEVDRWDRLERDQRRARLRVTPSTSTPWPAAPARRAARLATFEITV